MGFPGIRQLKNSSSHLEGETPLPIWVAGIPGQRCPRSPCPGLSQQLVPHTFTPKDALFPALWDCPQSPSPGLGIPAAALTHSFLSPQNGSVAWSDEGDGCRGREISRDFAKVSMIMGIWGKGSPRGVPPLICDRGWLWSPHRSSIE